MSVAMITVGVADAAPPEINEAVARKVLEVVDYGLSYGIGDPEPGKMCVEAAVCYALGMPHDDSPPCVSQAVRAGKITLNDSRYWCDSFSFNGGQKARAEGLRALAIAQLGSAEICDRDFVAALIAISEERRIESAYIAAARVSFSENHYASAAARIARACCAIGTKAGLLLGVEIFLDALRHVNAPGIQWLYLLDEQQETKTPQPSTARQSPSVWRPGGS